MALIGTISGSNGTSTTAVTGSLIISDSPPGSFPTLPSGVRFFVNGVISGSSDLRVTGNITGSNALLSGDLAVNGGDLTTTATSFNLLTTALTGTLNIGTLANAIVVGGTTTTSSFSGDLAVAGRTTLAGVTERMTHTQGGSTLTCDMTGSSIFYLNKPAGNVTANFTNVPTTNNRIITPTVILSQSSPAYIVSIVQVDGAGQTINWANGTTPTGTANKQDVFGFSLIRSGSAWKVLGQMSTYG